MGFDISNHAIDTRFMTETLIPALNGKKPVGDFAERAANLCAVAARANQWGLRTLRLDHAIGDRQRSAGPERKVRQAKKAGFLSRLMGRQEFEEYTLPARTSGLPGFESDLCVWGRPFFIVADSVEESLATFERYMQCGGRDLSAVDSLAKEMLARLEKNRHRLAPDLHPAVVAVLDSFYPLLAHLPAPDGDDGGDVDFAKTRARIASQLDPYIKGWAQRDTDALIEDDSLEEAAPARDLAAQAPFVLINLAAQQLPGWMGRGQVWPTALFEKIGVPVSDVFETPVALFEPLVRDFPEIEERFDVTINENFSLGGYVPPAKVPALNALLKKHERDLILAWMDDKSVSAVDLDGVSSDYKKILEPVTLAERRGYGFIEAAEVYSGFMGVMN